MMRSVNPGVQIFQIYYSAATRAALDPGFLPLDNLANARPDWREYWPIREFLRQGRIAIDGYYGFLSPRFQTKTNLSASVVGEFVRTRAPTADVVLLSPFYDQMAFFLNPWEQAVMVHRNVREVFEQALALIAPAYDPYGTVATSLDTVFCNYFVARGEFWLAWLERCERIFESAERAETPLGRALSDEAVYETQTAPTKTFVIERVAGTLLAERGRWSVAAYNSLQLPFSGSRISELGAELAALDALKIAYLREPRREYLQSFFRLRDRYASALRKA
jgi:hypothetical protein